MSSGIYRIVCTKNGRYYYGSALDMSGRWKIHTRSLKRGHHYNTKMQRYWNEHGEQSFKMEQIEFVSPEQLEEVEDRYLAEHVGKPNCMNVRKTVHILSWREIWSDHDLRTKILKRRRKYFDLPETRQKLSEQSKRAWQSMSDAEKVERGNAISKTRSTQESKDRTSKQAKEQWKDPEFRKRVGQKIREAQKKRWENMSPEQRKERGIQIRLAKAKLSGAK